MKNFLKIFVFSVFISLISISPAMAYSVNISFAPQTVAAMIPTVGYPAQSNINKSVPYNFANTQIQWTTVGVSSCTCSYWDVASGSKKNCTPSGATVSPNPGTAILSTIMPSLKAFKIQTTGAVDNYATVSCIPIPCIKGSQVLDSGSGTFTVQTSQVNCNNFTIEAWGGGGGGAGGWPDGIYGGGAEGGGGGGGGGYSKVVKSLKLGDTLSYTVGAGGRGADGGTRSYQPPAGYQENYPNNAGKGEQTSVLLNGINLLISSGGNPGNSVNGGSGGAGSSGNGGNGFNGDSSSKQGGGDGGSSPNGGGNAPAHGNNGNNTQGNGGDNGYGPGGGGAGGGGADGGSSSHSGGGGGAGANGRVKITWN